MKSLAQKMTEKNAFFRKIHVSDLLSPSRSPQVTGLWCELKGYL